MFTLEANDYNVRLKQVRDDYLLYARGVARLYYEPVMEANPAYLGEDGLDTAGVEGEAAALQADQAAGAPSEILKFEHVKLAYIQRKDFVHGWARTWEELPWLAFRSYLSRKELRTRFPAIADEISLDASPERSETDRPTSSDSGSDDKATIWEIWNREAGEVLWVAEGYANILEQGPPYLLQGFFPCPKPAYGTLTNDSLEPVPDFTYYQDQCEEIDTLTGRIASIQDSLKIVGFYPAGPEGEGSPEVERAAQPGFENKLIAVKSWAMFKEGGSGGAPIVWWPVDQVVKVLEGCVQARQQLIDDVYQIYGLSDIMRGDGNAQETATAQSIKAQFGSVRIRDRQQELARFCRDVCRMIAEIICTQFQPETLMAMANMPLVSDAEVQQQQMMQALQSTPQGGPMGLGGPMPPPGIASPVQPPQGLPA